MPFDLSCPGCGANFSVPENLAGKKIRCKTPGCGTMILVGPNLADASDDIDDLPNLPPAATKVMATLQPRFRGEEPPAPRPTPMPIDDDDLPVATPRLVNPKISPAGSPTANLSAKPKSNLPVVIGGAAVGVFALVIVGLGIYFMSQPEDNRSAKNKQTITPPPIRTQPEDPLIDPAPPQPKQPEPQPQPKQPRPQPEPKVTDPEPKQPPVVEPEPKQPPKQPPVRELTIGKLNAQQTAEILRSVVRVEYEPPNAPPVMLAGICAGPSGVVLVPRAALRLTAEDNSAPGLFLVSVQLATGRVQKLEANLLTIDRNTGLVLLRVNDVRCPQPLKVVSAGKIGRSGEVYLVGLGDLERLEPLVYQIHRGQVESVITQPPSNSPQGLVVRFDGQLHVPAAAIVDATGNLVGIQVNTVNNGIVISDRILPTIAGRLQEPTLGLAYRTGDPQIRNEKLRVSIRVPVQDPLGQIKRVSVVAWTGLKSALIKPEPVEAPYEDGDSNHDEQTLKLENGVATGEIVFPLLSANNSEKIYRYQLVHTDLTNNRYYLPVRTYEPTGSLVERRSWLAELTMKESFKPTTVKFEKTERINIAAEGKEINFKKDTKVGFKEYVKRVEKNGNATVRWQIESYEGDLPGLDEVKELAKIDKAVRDLLQKIGIEATLSKTAEMQKPRIDLGGVPAILQAMIKNIATELGDDLELATVPLPGKVLSAGATWKVTRTQELPDIKGKKTKGGLVYNIEYTYVGIRKVDGRDEVYVTCEGTLASAGGSPMTFKGTVNGSFFIEPTSSQVMRSDVTLRAEISGSPAAELKELTGTALGTFRLERIPALR